jgi:hypothetical protein
LLLTGFVASVSAALFHAGVSAVFMAPGSMLVGLFVLIAFFGLIGAPFGQVSVSNSAISSIRRRSIVLALTATISVAWLAWMGEVLHYHRAMAEDKVYYQEHSPDGTMPRFWLHGNFPRFEQNIIQ